MNFSVLLPHPPSCSQLSPLMFSIHKFCSSLLPKPVLDTQILKWLLPSLSWSLTCITFSSYCSLDTNLSTDPWAPHCCPDLCCCHSDRGPGPHKDMGSSLPPSKAQHAHHPLPHLSLIRFCRIPLSLLSLPGPAACCTCIVPGHQFCSAGFLSSSPVLSNCRNREMWFLVLPCFERQP